MIASKKVDSMCKSIIMHRLSNVFKQSKSVTLGILIVIAMLFCTQAHAQLNKEGKAPEEVVLAFKAKYFPLEVITWEWDSKILNYRAHFYEDAKEYTAFFDTFGKWIRTSRVIRESELPEEIKFNISNSSFKDWKVRSIEEELNKENDIVYRMEIATPGTNGRRPRRIMFLTFLPDGLLLNMERNL